MQLLLLAAAAALLLAAGPRSGGAVVSWQQHCAQLPTLPRRHCLNYSSTAPSMAYRLWCVRATLSSCSSARCAAISQCPQRCTGCMRVQRCFNLEGRRPSVM